MVNELKGPELNTLKKANLRDLSGGLVAKSPLARAGEWVWSQVWEAAIRHRPQLRKHLYPGPRTETASQPEPATRESRPAAVETPRGVKKLKVLSPKGEFYVLQFHHTHKNKADVSLWEKR